MSPHFSKGGPLFPVSQAAADDHACSRDERFFFLVTIINAYPSVLVRLGKKIGKSILHDAMLNYLILFACLYVRS